jgi:hypothetical protein
LASADGVLVVATDNDRAGDRYHAQLAEMAQAAGVRSERLLPAPDQDWNDSLKQGRGGMKPDRAWVLLGSGRRLDLIDPQPDAFTDADLATGLSRTYRWGGHSNRDLPLSVAQHSLLVLVLRQRMQPHQPLTPGEALRELLHDADEGLLGFDPISPLKPHLGAAFDALTAACGRRLRSAMACRTGRVTTTSCTNARTISPRHPKRCMSPAGRGTPSARRSAFDWRPSWPIRCRCLMDCNPGSPGRRAGPPRCSWPSCAN